MIRPIPDFGLLPIYVYTFDRRMRARQREFANFVIAPAPPEPRGRLDAFLSALTPLTPNIHTWICEDHWIPLGLAQARTRPGGEAWDLTYLCAMTAPGGRPPVTDPEDVLTKLIEYTLDAAILRGVHRFFARVEDERPELEIFSRLSFQRYAREVTYWLASPAEGLAALDAAASRPRPEGEDETVSPEAAARLDLRTAPALRPWHRHDAWGLLRLYDAGTPRRVQVAESLTNDEFVHTRAGGGRTWSLPLLEPRCVPGTSMMLGACCASTLPAHRVACRLPRA